MFNRVNPCPVIWLGLLLAVNFALQWFLAIGEIKSWSEINWIDVFGEGGSALFAMLWIHLILRGRPTGRVTWQLTLGLSLMGFAWWMDVLDEFIRLPAELVWDNWLETAPMPFGLILLTMGIYHLHQEQKAISQQMQKREKVFREHRLFDALTPLNNAQYLRHQLHRLLEQTGQQAPVSLLVLDINHFSRINQRYGMAEGDAVLQALTQLLLLNLRSQDLLCRLAGDRFVVLLPDTAETQAKQLAADLVQLIKHWCYYSQRHQQRLPIQACAAVVMAFDDDVESLLQRLHIALARAKSNLDACA